MEHRVQNRVQSIDLKGCCIKTDANTFWYMFEDAPNNVTVWIDQEGKDIVDALMNLDSLSQEERDAVLSKCCLRHLDGTPYMEVKEALMRAKLGCDIGFPEDWRKCHWLEFAKHEIDWYIKTERLFDKNGVLLRNIGVE